MTDLIYHDADCVNHVSGYDDLEGRKWRMIITVYPPLACRNIPGNPSIAGDFLNRLSEDISCFSHKKQWYQVQIALILPNYRDITTK